MTKFHQNQTFTLERVMVQVAGNSPQEEIFLGGPLDKLLKSCPLTQTLDTTPADHHCNQPNLIKFLHET